MMKAYVTRCALTFAAMAILMLALAAPATAATQTIKDQQNFSVFVPCANGGAGENVDGIVKVHAVFGMTTDSAGGLHLHAQAKLQGVGIGSVTGDSYQLHADVPEFIFGDRINDNAGGSMNGAIHFNVDAIGMGDAPNYSLNIDYQVTYNANGVLTMEKGFFIPVETCH